MVTTEDILQHAGVKGMKWGVRKDRRKAKKLAKSQAKLDKFHNFRKDGPTYNKNYQKALKENNNDHYKTVGKIKAERDKALKGMRNAVLLGVAVTTLTTGANGAVLRYAGKKVAKKVIQKAGEQAMKPENIRLGKNIINMAKRNPVRYVDGQTLSNVINPLRDLASR